MRIWHVPQAVQHSCTLVCKVSAHLDASSTRRALGVDYGRRQIGLAVSTLGFAPRPLAFLRAGGYAQLAQTVDDVVTIAQREQCDAIVVGLPVTRSGSLRLRQSDSQQGRRCRNFSEAVAAVAAPLNIHVYLVDERGTTAEAESLMYAMGEKAQGIKRKKDSVAAALILSAFFDQSSDITAVPPPKIVRRGV